MGIILWLIIGGVVGWLASIVMKRDGSQGIFLNIVVGIVGSAKGKLAAGCSAKLASYTSIVPLAKSAA